MNEWAHSLAMYYELELQTAMNKLIITCNCRLSRGRATNLKLHDLETADRHQPEAHGSLHIHVLQRHALLLDRSYLALKPYYSGPTSSFHQVMQPLALKRAMCTLASFPGRLGPGNEAMCTCTCIQFCNFCYHWIGQEWTGLES